MPLGGRPLVAYALDAFRSCPAVREIVLVVAAEDVERARRELLHAGGGRSERVVAGGAERQASVAAALAELSPAVELVAVHDGARPFVSQELIGRCFEAAAARGAAIAAVPATDTVKEVGAQALVVKTLDRSRLWFVQTPQVFRRKLLVGAYEAAAEAGFEATDDASLVERLGHEVVVVPGEPENIKVTWPSDVRRSEQMLMEKEQGRPVSSVRAGMGYDAHRFSEDRPLVLAGVRIREDRGLLGHSDADVVCHAVCDALLGAMGAGDIGEHFPDTDPAYAGISSLSLLARVGRLVREAGWEIGNIDAVVIAQEPRIAPHIADMRTALAGALETDPGRISVKGKTTEGMGFTGRREGIASQAVALLRPRESASETQSEE